VYNDKLYSPIVIALCVSLLVQFLVHSILYYLKGFHLSQEVCYSLEKKIVIDADVAYDLYWAKQIFDKSKFKCPTPTCQAKFTCANMDVAEHDLKQTPHFRKHPSTEHDSLCPFHEDNTISNNYTDGITNGKNNIKSNIEIFEFERPPAHFQNYDINSEKKENKSRSKNSSSGKSNSPNNKRYYTLRSIVNNYIKYRASNTLETKTIFIENEYTYKKLFKGIYNQDFLNINMPHVFWQKAWVHRTKNNDAYMINFAESFIYNDKKIKPNIYISDKVVESSFNKNLLKIRLDNALGKKSPEVVVFIYGKPNYREYNKGSIGFYLDNLDLLEVRLAKDFYNSLGS